MTIPLFQVDSFTSRPFAGNPAGVCILSEPKPDVWMMAVAREMNLSETAFLLPEGSGYRLRWFTPKVEVALCGHATLASAHILWQQGLLGEDQKALFYTLSGELSAVLETGGWIVMDFPAHRVTAAEPPAGLLEALGVKAARFTGSYRESHLVELAGEDEVRALAPDFSALLRVKTRSVAVTARSADPTFDFVSRYFAPAVGIDEDPVTGSAHCALAPYWAEKLGKPEISAYQASARGGALRARLAGERVLLYGQAVTVLKGELLALA